MPENWKTYKLDEISQIGSSKRIFRADYVEKGIPFYRSKEIIQKSFNENISDPLFIDEQKYLKIKENFGSPGNGDILISSVGNRSGIPYLVNNDGDFYFKDGNLLWFRNFNKEVYSPYLYQWLKSNIGQNLLLSSMIGSAQKALTIEGVKNLDINLPLYQEQKSIASTLSALDDKIELNLLMNKTLEEMAMALYKHWFVDFGPFQEGEFVDSEFGEIPKGWEVVRVDEIANFIDPHPSHRAPKVEENGYPFAGIGDIDEMGNINSNKARKIGLEAVKKQEESYKLNGTSVGFGRVGTVGKVIRLRPQSFRYSLSPTMAVIDSIQEEYSEFIFYLVKSNGFLTQVFNNQTGSTRPTIGIQTLRALKTVIPKDIKIIRNFRTYVKFLYEKGDNLNQENQILTQLRDTLLPKLISGEVRVKDMEKTLSEML